mmetsp:Transcript_14572/g.58197  ORF Transcript_14572/g.58197 Transcript_14572/m.58197 type:complete len:261 (+) Transcript_14572:71-853(+)
MPNLVVSYFTLTPVVRDVGSPAIAHSWGIGRGELVGRRVVRVGAWDLQGPERRVVGRLVSNLERTRPEDAAADIVRHEGGRGGGARSGDLVRENVHVLVVNAVVEDGDARFNVRVASMGVEPLEEALEVRAGGVVHALHRLPRELALAEARAAKRDICGCVHVDGVDVVTVLRAQVVDILLHLGRAERCLVQERSLFDDDCVDERLRVLARPAVDCGVHGHVLGAEACVVFMMNLVDGIDDDANQPLLVDLESELVETRR